MNIAEEYFEGLKNAYEERRADEWTEFMSVAHGATDEDISALKAKFPDVPESLIWLLKRVDGTYRREYAGKKRRLYFLGSKLEEYPYYLLSAEQMAKHAGIPAGIDEIIDGEFGDRDERLINDSRKGKWLHFSDCMNNGGTSQLFIDFSPSDSGQYGQVVMYVHDPDEVRVIADSFDEYLKMLMDYGFDFIMED